MNGTPGGNERIAKETGKFRAAARAFADECRDTDKLPADERSDGA